MIIKEESGGSNYEPIAKGRHEAICVTVAGIGEQETAYGTKNQVILTWEIPSIVREWSKDGETQTGRAQISRTFTCSLAPKASLRQVLEDWRDKEFTQQELGGFDLQKLLGVPCTLKIKHQTSQDGSRTYANIADVEPYEGSDKLEPEAKLVHYDPMNHSNESFDNLPQWIQSKVTAPNSAVANDNPPPKEADIEELEDMPF
jgi:hypothetical protein